MAPSLIEAQPMEISSVGKITPAQPNDGFHKLVKDLNAVLGASGIDSDDIDVKTLEQLMIDYASNEKEWNTYSFADFTRGYTRNLVDRGNGKSNLLILVWTPGKGSPVHDHADAHCVMKVLKGSLKETRYNFPKNNATAPEVIKETIYKQEEVTYMADELGLHKISNPDPEKLAVSLHLYTPPNAAKEGCNIFCERTGKRSHVSQSNFYSIFGCKMSSFIMDSITFSDISFNSQYSSLPPAEEHTALIQRFLLQIRDMESNIKELENEIAFFRNLIDPNKTTSTTKYESAETTPVVIGDPNGAADLVFSRPTTLARIAPLRNEGRGTKRCRLDPSEWIGARELKLRRKRRLWFDGGIGEEGGRSGVDVDVDVDR